MSQRRRRKKHIVEQITTALEIQKHPHGWTVVVSCINTRLNGAFPSRHTAAEAAREADQICDWPSMVQSSRDGDAIFDRRRAQYKSEWDDIRKRNGGEIDYEENTVDAATIAARLPVH